MRSLCVTSHCVPGRPDQALSFPRCLRATVLSASAHPRWALSRQGRLICPEGRVSSLNKSNPKTKSPTSMLGFTWNHFCRDCKSGKYSRVHLFQNWVAMYCTYRHRVRYTSAVSKLPHGNEATPRIANRWFGVKASQSLTSSLDFVIGRPLMMH